jgi:hypothetical protein
MSELLQVTPSGSVGKQVFASTKPVVLKSVVLDAPTSAGSLTIRDGNASGDIRLTANQALGGTKQIELCGKRFDRGMHVKVTGVDATCYLEIE